MAILPKHLDYTDLDQESIERRIFRLVDGTFPEWSERQRINYGNLLVGSIAFVGDILAFLMDNHAKESRWGTARLRRSIRNHAKLIGYKLASAKAGQADVVITIPVLTSTLTIPAGTRVFTDDVARSVSYQTLTDAVFAPGETTKTVTAEDSATHVETFVSDGRPNQSFQLARAGVLDGSVVVVAANGTYSAVDDFLDSQSTSRDMVVDIDDQDRANVKVGDGITGAIPIGSITITYKTGGGKKGAVEPNTLRRIGTFSDGLGNPVNPTVTNPLASSGSDDRESNARARVKAPRSLRVQGRSTGREDYEIVAEAVPGVARALHLTGNENAAIGENQGQLFLVPTGGGTPTLDLINQVKAQFEPLTGPYPKTNTYQLLVAGAPYMPINYESVVYLTDNSPAGRAAARAAIMASLSALHALSSVDERGEEVINEAVNFGYYLQGPFPWSTAFNAIRDSVGVRKLDAASGLLLNGQRDDVELSAAQFPTLGSVVLIDGATGEAF